MQRIKAVIFDLDGTLADTLPLCIQAFRRSIEPLIHRSLSDADIIATFGPSEEGTIMALAPGYYEEGVAGYLHCYESLHAMCAVPFEGITTLLDTLKQKKVSVSMVTGKGRYSTAISLKYFALTDYFTFIETGSPAGPRKAEGIQLILDRLPEIAKSEIVYVGDAPSDINASRKAGIAVVAAAWANTAEPEKLKEVQPDELFFTVQELTDWLSERV